MKIRQEREWSTRATTLDPGVQAVADGADRLESLSLRIVEGPVGGIACRDRSRRDRRSQSRPPHRRRPTHHRSIRLPSIPLLSIPLSHSRFTV